MPQFMDFMADSDDPQPQEPESESSGDFVQTVTVMPTPDSDDWCAMWAYDANNGHEVMTGSKTAALEWARQKAARIFVYNQDTENLDLL